jgi:hypothetical protein
VALNLSESPYGRATSIAPSSVLMMLSATSSSGPAILKVRSRWPSAPIAGTGSCEAPHFQYHVSGRLAIRMDDGTEMVAGPGDITSLPKGHDAWVVGDEPVVVVDWYGASSYAKGG